MECIVRTQVSDIVAQRIVDYIRSAGLGPGDRLPSERKLLTDLHVSRPSLREALSGLAATGLIDSQHGRGIFVARPRLLTLLAHGPFPSLLNTVEELRHFTEARRALEPELTSLASLHSNADDLEAMRSALHRQEIALAAGEFEVQPALDLHAAIFRAAHNPILLEMALPISDLLAEAAARLDLSGDAESRKESFRVSLEMHSDLFEAVRSGNPDKARCASHAHIDVVYHKLLATLDCREEIIRARGGDDPLK